MRKLMIIPGVALLLASCGGMNSAVNTNNQPSISGTSWQLADNVKGTVPTLIINGDKINGNAGCNSYFGELRTDAASGLFVAEKIGSTRKACANMETEQNFLNMLPQANRYRVNENLLEIYKDQLLLLKFRKIQ